MALRFRRKRQKEAQTIAAPEVLEELEEARQAKHEAYVAHANAVAMHQEATEIAKKLKAEREHNHFAERFVRAMGGGMI